MNILTVAFSFTRTVSTEICCETVVNVVDEQTRTSFIKISRKGFIYGLKMYVLLCSNFGSMINGITMLLVV